MQGATINIILILFTGATFRKNFRLYRHTEIKTHSVEAVRCHCCLSPETEGSFREVFVYNGGEAMENWNMSLVSLRAGFLILFTPD